VVPSLGKDWLSCMLDYSAALGVKTRSCKPAKHTFSIREQLLRRCEWTASMLYGLPMLNGRAVGSSNQPHFAGRRRRSLRRIDLDQYRTTTLQRVQAYTIESEAKGQRTEISNSNYSPTKSVIVRASGETSAATRSQLSQLHHRCGQRGGRYDY